VKRFLIPLSVLLSLLFAVPAQAIELAVQDDAVLLNEWYYGREKGLDRAQEIGARSVRFNMLWTDVLPAAQAKARKRPAVLHYDFSRYDAAIDAARARGLKVQLTITAPAPAWATGDHKLGVRRPKPALFARFAATVAAHFNGRLRAISVWNEPNWPWWLASKMTCRRRHGKKVCASQAARDYRRLYTAAYTAIKRVSPRTPVWLGELGPSGMMTSRGPVVAPLRFLRDMLCVTPDYRKRRCAPVKADGVALHPYMLGRKPSTMPRGKDDVVIGTLGRLDNALSRLHRLRALRTPSGRPMPVFLTEFGYQTSNARRAVSPRLQSQYLKQAFKLAARHTRVKQLLLYVMVDPTQTMIWHSGLLYHSGAPKPVFAMLKALFGAR